MGVGGRVDQLARRVHLVADARNAQKGITAAALKGNLAATGLVKTRGGAAQVTFNAFAVNAQLRPCRFTGRGNHKRIGPTNLILRRSVVAVDSGRLQIPGLEPEL